MDRGIGYVHNISVANRLAMLVKAQFLVIIHLQKALHELPYASVSKRGQGRIH